LFRRIGNGARTTARLTDPKPVLGYFWTKSACGGGRRFWRADGVQEYQPRASGAPPWVVVLLLKKPP